ncbi:hypothetical protein [Kitasatospora fiedleri]|uniref:hypothetical protein n=1 Tax=Kitasatospora fiedleri TaxID=2991545 RepID=UPI000CAD6CD5|nr:hypothetical protein [Kitasatospora fiedleri]
MSEMNDRLDQKDRRDEEDVRAADPEEGITSYQTMHAGEESRAEGDPTADPSQQQEERR